jgi:glyoxylase-like metal-dependent hydrolase (beta-lactamase superfamily II)
MEIVPGIYEIGADKGGYFKAGYTKAFMIDDGDGLIILDAFYDDDAQLFLDEIALIGKTPQDIKHILMTHAHRGHLGGLATLKRLSGAPVYSHAWEADIIAGDRPMHNASIFAFDPIQSWPITTIGQIIGPWNRHEGVPVDQLIDEGDKVGPIEVLHTPGHTPGHLTFYWPERRALFTGDSFVTWPSIVPGWDSTMLNEPQSWDSLDRMTTLDVEVIGPGHGDSIRQNGSQVLKNLAKKRKV